MYDNYLMHYGVKGMKWGVRRYQPKSGTGRKRKTGSYSNAFKPGPKGKPSPAEKIARSAGETINPTKNIISRTQKRKYYDTSNMSDDELRRKINRMELNKRYNTLMNEDLSPWRQRVSDILDIAGDTLAIAGSAAAIGTAVYQIRKKNHERITK